MSDIVYVYCDESCHLERDHQKAMVLGAMWAPADIRKSIGRHLKALKQKHGISPGAEAKWTKVSPGKLAFYLALVDLFFEHDGLGFRAVVVPNKNILDHGRFDQTHDEFYYKMWWQLLTRAIDDQHSFRIFIDLKDTHGKEKRDKLHDVLCNAFYDFDRQRIVSIEGVHSHDVPILQLADLFIGALSHHFRGLRSSAAKQAVIDRIRARSKLTLQHSTPPQARKFNLFIWRGQGGGGQ